MLSLRQNLSNLPGWSTKRKLVVFESDDWGSARMPSKEVFNILLSHNINPINDDEARYLQNDGLASEKDLSCLFETLSGFKDINDNNPIFTAFTLVTNPDFNKIRNNNFMEYYYERFTDTLKKYPDHARSFELWKEGITRKIFIPEFHGREHLNVTSWLRALQSNNRDTVIAFENGVYGITPKNPINNITYQSAFNIENISEIPFLQNVIRDGLNLFEELFGYKASVFVPTNGWFNNYLENELFNSGVKFIGVSKIQKEPIGDGKIKRIYHYLGQKNKFNQIYLTRNCFFEPSSNWKSDWINACLQDINISFRWNKPAVISTHRVNYIGFINPENRSRGLKQLYLLLKNILKIWPDVEFISSRELGKIIQGNIS